MKRGLILVNTAPSEKAGQWRHPPKLIAGRDMKSDDAGVFWNERADAFCKAWSSEVGHPDFQALSKLYAADADVVIYDTLAPIHGFLGFEQMRQSIYPALMRIHVQRTGPIAIKQLANGSVVVTSYPFHLSYGFAGGTDYEIEARISEVWEKRGGEYVIVHEHPSTVYDLPATSHPSLNSAT
jgi:ketosteroid isomerase-like protein